MKRETLMLRLAVIALVLPPLVIGIFFLPQLAADATGHRVAGQVYLAVGALYAAMVPYGAVLWQALRLLSLIDRNAAFSSASVAALGRIKCGAVLVGAGFAATLPVFYYIADIEDAPGVMVLGLAFAAAPFVIAVFAAVLQTFLRHAVALKSEVDLTV